MPDPIEILKAMSVAAGVAAATLAAIALPRRPVSTARIGIAWTIATGLGFVAGCWMLGQSPKWPPKVDLDRLLVVVLPLVVTLECGLAFFQFAQRFGWPVRIIVVLAAIRILLHNSVYLVGVGDSRWSTAQTWLNYGTSTVVVVGSWFALQWFSDRRHSVIGSLVLALNALASGLAIMLSGYASGGQLAMPLAAAIVGAAIVQWLAYLTGSSSLGVGYLLVCCLVFVGIHFAELSTFHALLLATAPVWSLLSELPRVRDLRPWIKNTLAVALVCVPLAIVVMQAKLEFDEQYRKSDPSEPSVSDYL